MPHTRCSKWHLGSIVYTRNTTNNPQTQSGLCPVAPIKNLDAFFKGSTAFWKDGLAKGHECNRLAELSEFSRLLHLTNNIFLCSRSRSVVEEMNSHKNTACLTKVRHRQAAPMQELGTITTFHHAPTLSQIYHHWTRNDKLSENLRKTVMISHIFQCIKCWCTENAHVCDMSKSNRAVFTALIPFSFGQSIGRVSRSVVAPLSYLLNRLSLEGLLKHLPGNQMCVSEGQVEQFMSNLTALGIRMDMLCEVALFTS